MQNPKNKLEPGSWYQVASKVILHRTKSAYSSCVAKIESGSMVMFLEYHTGSVRTCKVMFEESIGWIMINPKYKDHLHFFKKVNIDLP